MTDNKDQHPLVPASSGTLTRSTDGPHGILARMSSDMLEIMRAKDRALEQARFRIGDYEFRGPDYRQILRWAEALDRSPEDVVEVLSGMQSGERPGGCRFETAWTETIEFSVVDGYIHSLAWDFAKLPLDVFTWENGLRLHTLAYRSKPPSGDLPRTFPSCLNALCCKRLGLEELDLASVPCLRELYCNGNQLTDLDLSNVLELTKLYCWDNQLSELDLSNVPQLTKLDCADNQLSELDLSNVPQLTTLNCVDNQLSELDLSNVPGLTELYCGYNQLTDLDLSNLPGLTELYCDGNRLADLDLSNVPGLTELHCRKNQLTELDLSSVPKLTFFSCGGNQLTDLDVSSVPGLTWFFCGDNQLTELDIRPLKNLEYLSVDAQVRIIGTPPAGCLVEH